MIAASWASSQSSWRTVVLSVFRGRAARAARERSGVGGSSPRPVRKLRATPEGFASATAEQTQALGALMSLIERPMPAGGDSRIDLSWRAQSWRWERIHALLAEALMMGASDEVAASRRDRNLDHALSVEAKLARSLADSVRARHQEAMTIVQDLRGGDGTRPGSPRGEGPGG